MKQCFLKTDSKKISAGFLEIWIENPTLKIVDKSRSNGLINVKFAVNCSNSIVNEKQIFLGKKNLKPDLLTKLRK